MTAQMRKLHPKRDQSVLTTQLPTPLSLQFPTLFTLLLYHYTLLPSLVLSVQSRIKFSDRHLIVLRNGILGEELYFNFLELK
jgi:hypothetical protein